MPLGREGAADKIASALGRNGERGLTVNQIAEITGLSRQWALTVLRHNPRFERSGRQDGASHFWRIALNPEPTEESMPTTTTDPPAGLWGGIKIPVIGLTGEHQSGKTLFGMLIDPEHTLVYDFEKSSETYVSPPVKKRIDTSSELLAKFPKGYKPLDMFRWWKEHTAAVKPGEYTVIFVDPISDLETGLADWVASRHEEFGFKSASNFESTGGIFWNYVRNEWKSILVDLASRCETFVFSSHLKQVWKGGKPTNIREPKGKSTLNELCSLYLRLERKLDANGKLPREPAGVVLKSRLAVGRQTEGGWEMQPILPPRLPVATSAAIRQYVGKPPDYKRLKTAELAVPEQLTEDDKREIEAQIAADKRAAAEADLSRLELMASAAKKRAAADEQRARENANPDQSGEQAVAAEQKAQESAQADAETEKEPEKEPETQPKTKPEPDLQAERNALLQHVHSGRATLKIPDDRWLMAMQDRGVKQPEELDLDGLKNLKAKLEDLILRRALQEEYQAALKKRLLGRSGTN